MELFQNKQIITPTRIEMITSIAVPMYQQMTHPTLEEYTSVCNVSETFIICKNLKHDSLTITCFNV